MNLIVGIGGVVVGYQYLKIIFAQFDGSLSGIIISLIYGIMGLSRIKHGKPQLTYASVAAAYFNGQDIAVLLNLREVVIINSYFFGEISFYFIILIEYIEAERGLLTGIEFFDISVSLSIKLNAVIFALL